MRRLAVLCALVLVAGCNRLQEAFTARPSAAVEAAGMPLGVERLAEYMVGLKGLPLNAEAARGVAGLWIDHTLFAQALARGDDLTDSAFAAEALWADLVQLQAARWHDSLMAERVSLAASLPDSIYRTDRERILQHILVRADAKAPAHIRQVARLRAEQLRGRITSGTPFAEVARQGSEDDASKSEGGYLPLAAKGRWVTSFDSAGWSLAPGQMSPIIETPFGYHVIRRPPLEEVRDRLTEGIRSRVGASLDSVYMDSLGVRRKLTPVGSAPALIRAAIADFDGALRSDETLARWDGGRLTVGEFARWLNALGPAFINDVVNRPDSALKLLTQAIGQNVLLLEEANAHGVGVSREDWAQLMEEHRSRIDSLRTVLGLGPDKLDSVASPRERSQVAALAIDQYWTRVAKGEGRPYPMPGPLALALRQRYPYRFHPAGLDGAVAWAQELQAREEAESSRPTPPPAQGTQPNQPIVVPPDSLKRP
jgi:hypothetical protein